MTRIKQNAWPRLDRSGAVVLFLAFLTLLSDGELAAQTLSGEADEPWLRPYTGPTRTDIDATTLDGKVLCGYQGWFNTPGDGTNFGYVHWGQGLNQAGGGRFTVDMWPDTGQLAIFRALGIRTVFVGMFDEVDEGTAIYKVSDQVPVGKYFVNYEGLPSDWYLRVTGAATQMIRGEAPLSEKIPEKLPFPKE